MSSSYFRVSSTTASNLTPSDINELVSSLLQVANLTVEFLGGLGKDTTPSTPTLSSPRPQTGATAGTLTATLLSTFVAAPQGTTCNLNTLPTNPSAPTISNLAPPSISLPSPYFSGLFGSVTILNFETLFNFLVIACLLYLFFTPPVGDASADESSGAIDISTDDSELNVPKIHPLYPCHTSATSMAKSSRPRKTQSSNSAKLPVALISSGKSLDHSPIERSLVLYSPPPTTPAGGSERLAQPTTTIEPPARVDPKPRAKAAEDTKQTTCVDSKELQRFWDSDKFLPKSFPPYPARKPTSPLLITAPDHAGPSELRNPENTNTQSGAGSRVGNEEGKEVSGVIDKPRWHPVWEVVPNRNVEPVQKTVAPRERAPVTILDANPQPQPRSQPLTLKPSVWTQVPLYVPQQPFIPRPAANFPLPTIPVGSIHAIVPVTQGPPPMISVPAQPPMPVTLHTAPQSWLQQQVVIGPATYVQTQPVAPLVPFVPLPHTAQPTFAPVLIDHHNESEFDQGMDIVDDDGDSWMRPDEIGEEITPPESAPLPLVQTLVIPTNDVPQCTNNIPQCTNNAPQDTNDVPQRTHDAPQCTNDIPQRTHVIEPAQRPTVGLTLESLDPNARRLRKKVHTSRLPYGSHPSSAPLAPSTNRWVGRLRRSIQPRRGGSTYRRHHTQNRDIARAARLEKRSLLRKKLAARTPKPQCSKEPILLCVDEQPKAADRAPLTDPLSTQKKARTYYDRLHGARASPFSQRGPSEVSLLACKAVPKSASLRKAFILGRHFEARDRRVAGRNGRINVVRQNDPTVGQQTVAGSQQRSVPLQGKAPVGDYVCPRRKRKTAADFIRAEDAEKEKEVLDAAADALQSMGLNSEASVPASSSSVPASDAPVPGPTTLSSSVTQDPEFNQDQAQLLLEDIFEDFEKKQSDLTTGFFSPSSASGFGSDSDSDSD